MGFRDDGDAARARAEALERENRELQEKIAALEGAQVDAEPETDGSGPSSNLLIGAIRLPFLERADRMFKVQEIQERAET
jgi:hypothetical protein